MSALLFWLFYCISGIAVFVALFYQKQKLTLKQLYLRRIRKNPRDIVVSKNKLICNAQLIMAIGWIVVVDSVPFREKGLQNRQKKFAKGCFIPCHFVQYCSICYPASEPSSFAADAAIFSCNSTSWIAGAAILKGLSHEIDFENFDQKLKNLA